MRVLVIPDVHLKSWLFDNAEAILEVGKADMAVCLMDIPDDWGMDFQVEKYRETYDRAISFAKKFPNTLWCYGNHDVSYPWGMLESGYSPYAENTVISKLEELEHSLEDESQIYFLHRIDNVLFSHGGLTEAFVERLGMSPAEDDIDDIVAAVNDAPGNYLWDNASPLWLRPQYDAVEGFRSDIYKQVVGHTPVEVIYEKNGFISTDVFSTHRDGRQIGESAMIVIDSVTGEYEKVGIPFGNGLREE